MAYWIWLALGFGLAALEAATLTFVLIWFGIAAVIVGLAVWTMPGLDDSVQFGGFGALSLALLVPAWMNIRDAARGFHERGIFINSVEYPAVPISQQRFRISLMADHTPEDISRLLTAVEEVWAEAAAKAQGPLALPCAA